MMINKIEIGYKICLNELENPFGVVRQVAPRGDDEIVVYIQNEGNFMIPSQAIRNVNEQKVVVDRQQLDDRVRNAISRTKQ